MLKIDDRFSITQDSYNWVLREAVPGISKDGAPTTTERLRYYGTLGQLCHAVLDLAPKGYETLAEMDEALHEAHRALERTLREHSLQFRRLTEGKV